MVVQVGLYRRFMILYRNFGNFEILIFIFVHFILKLCIFGGPQGPQGGVLASSLKIYRSLRYFLRSRGASARGERAVVLRVGPFRRHRAFSVEGRSVVLLFFKSIRSCTLSTALENFRKQNTYFCRRKRTGVREREQGRYEQDEGALHFSG